MQAGRRRPHVQCLNGIGGEGQSTWHLYKQTSSTRLYCYNIISAAHLDRMLAACVVQIDSDVVVYRYLDMSYRPTLRYSY
jgi:hypothetical protein